MHHGDGEVAVGVEARRLPYLRGVVDKAFCQPEGGWGDAVAKNEGVSNHGRMDRRGAAGYDAGAGAVESVAGVGDKVYIDELQGGAGVSRPPVLVASDKFLEIFAVNGGGYGQNEVGAEWEALSQFDHHFQICGDFLPAASRQKTDPGFFCIETVSGSVLFAGDSGFG